MMQIASANEQRSPYSWCTFSSLCFKEHKARAHARRNNSVRRDWWPRGFRCMVLSIGRLCDGCRVRQKIFHLIIAFEAAISFRLLTEEKGIVINHFQRAAKMPMTKVHRVNAGMGMAKGTGGGSVGAT